MEIGMNSPCYCGSNHKYKNCCGNLSKQNDFPYKAIPSQDIGEFLTTKHISRDELSPLFFNFFVSLNRNYASNDYFKLAEELISRLSEVTFYFSRDKNFSFINFYFMNDFFSLRTDLEGKILLSKIEEDNLEKFFRTTILYWLLLRHKEKFFNYESHKFIFSVKHEFTNAVFPIETTMDRNDYDVSFQSLLFHCPTNSEGKELLNLNSPATLSHGLRVEIPLPFPVVDSYRLKISEKKFKYPLVAAEAGIEAHEFISKSSVKIKNQGPKLYFLFKEQGREVCLELRDLLYHPFFNYLPDSLREECFHFFDFKLTRIREIRDDYWKSYRFTKLQYSSSGGFEATEDESLYHVGFVNFVLNMYPEIEIKKIKNRFYFDFMGHVLTQFLRNSSVENLTETPIPSYFSIDGKIKFPLSAIDVEDRDALIKPKLSFLYDEKNISYIYNLSTPSQFSEEFIYSSDPKSGLRVLYSNKNFILTLSNECDIDSLKYEIKSFLNRHDKRIPCEEQPFDSGHKFVFFPNNYHHLINIENSFNHFANFKRKLHYHFIIDSSIANRTAPKNLKSQIHIDRFDSNEMIFKICLNDPENSKYNLNFNYFWIKVFLEGFNKGINGACYGELKEYASKEDEMSRHFDLLYCRHAGIFRYLSMKIFDYLDYHFIKNPINFLMQRDEKFLNDCIDETCKILAEGRDDQKISATLASYIKVFIKNTIFELTAPQLNLSYLQGPIVVSRYEAFSENIKFLLMLYTTAFPSSSPISGFIKSKSSDVKFTLNPNEQFNFKNPFDSKIIPLLNFCSYEMKIELKKLPANYMDLLLSNPAIEIYLGGKKIQELNESDFQSQLSMKESKGEIDWFSLNPEIFFQGKKIDIQKAFDNPQGPIIEHEGNFYLINKRKLPSIKWLEFFWNQMKQRNTKKKSAILGHENYVQQERSWALEMLALHQSGVKVVGGDKWEELKSKYEGLGKNLSYPPTKANQSIPLLPYQREGISWLVDLYELGLGGILADDMGLGKTIQALSFIDHLREKNTLGAVLIVVPSSLVFNWIHESNKFTPLLKLKSYSEIIKENRNDDSFSELPTQIIIATYGQLLHNESWFLKYRWNLVLFDEAQNLKNIVASRTASARKLKANMKVALSGTPMENHYGEFYSLVDLVVPGALGEYDKFKKDFQLNSKISDRDYFDPRNVEFLKLKTKPIVLRRKKSEILSHLPEKIESEILLSFDKKQEKIYRDIAIACNNNVQIAIQNKGELNTQIEMLAALLKLRQVCSSPKLIKNLDKKLEYKDDSPKIERLGEMIEEIYSTAESVLVFTTFLTTIDLISEKLKEKNIDHKIISGQTSLADRKNILAEFTHSTAPMVLIMTLKTGGVGLNLTKARYVIHFEPWWNPAVENQATDRSHRMGQNKNVHVYRLLMNHSVEEKIGQLKSRKGKLFDALFEDKDFNPDEVGGSIDIDANKVKTNSRLSKDDFTYLLS
ncbi:MAG: SNF2-related protein [Bacteriovoracaceae bacterium]|nr:SNF2-related protein [Bacteriovoracaceae bacterium]